MYILETGQLIVLILLSVTLAAYISGYLSSHGILSQHKGIDRLGRTTGIYIRIFEGIAPALRVRSKGLAYDPVHHPNF